MKQPSTLSLSQKTVLGIQFLFVAFGATVLVPLLVGISPSIPLFTAGIGTLVFHLITKEKSSGFSGQQLCIESEGPSLSSGTSRWLESVCLQLPVFF